MRPATRRVLRAAEHIAWMIAGALLLAVGGAIFAVSTLMRRL